MTVTADLQLNHVTFKQEREDLETFRLGEWAIQQNLQAALTPRITHYHKQTPDKNIKQRVFLCLPVREALFGGAAGPGKSSALLMDALQYVDIPGYNAIILRKSYADLSKPGALMDRAAEWLKNTDAKWNEQKHMWRFPSGATLSFGFIDNTNDKYHYQSAEFQYIGFDELTQFREEDYRFMFSRLRRLQNVKIPTRMRGASNPGGFGHDWVKQRFIIEGKLQGKVFLPALLWDNPYIDHEDYIASLSNLDEITLRQLLAGDWDALPSSGFFQKNWFNVVENGPVGYGLRWIRFWDIANKTKKVHDFTAGALTTLTPKDGHFYIKDIQHGKWEAPDAIEIIYQCACMDPKGTEIFIEDTANGTAIAQTIMRQPRFQRFTIRTVPVSLSKRTRASGWASRARAGYVDLIQGVWINGFFDEIIVFGQEGVKDDRIDAVSGAYEAHSESVDKTLRRGR